MSDAPPPPRKNRVHPLVYAAAITAVIAAAGRLKEPSQSTAETNASPSASVTPANGGRPKCRGRTIPEGDACIPLPAPGAPLASTRAGAPAPRADHEPARTDTIPRLPGRPEEFDRYVLPVRGAASPREFSRAPFTLQRTALGLDLSAPLAEVTVVELEHQTGPARVAYAAELWKTTVITIHEVKEGGRTKRYAVFYGNLAHTEAPVLVGATLETGSLIGKTSSDAAEPLYFEVRLVREEARIEGMEGKRLADDATSIAVDPRNVLTLAR